MTFINQTISIPREDCDAWAQKAFYKISGLYRETPGKDKIKEMADLSLENIRYFVKPQAIITYFEKPTISGRRIQLGEEALFCQALEQVKPNSVKAAFVYGLTLGELGEDSEEALLRLMVDFWGTAYVDAARYKIREQIGARGKEENLILSDELGPGFFGMGMSNVWKFSKLIDLSKIGIQLGNKGMMFPEKSALGLFLLSEGEAITFEEKCLYCKGNEEGCKICMEETR